MAKLQYSDFLKQLYGCRVQKLNVNAGFTCPNRDGKLGWGGCTYCNNASFTPSFSSSSLSVSQQLSEGKSFYASKYSYMKFLAYFQSFTNTYASVSKLHDLYVEALSVPDVVGLVISTRPDCLSEEVLDCLCSINKQHRVIVEIGVETTHDHTLQIINRCHTWKCASEAIVKVARRGITVGAHLILGLPGENEDDMMTTVNAVSQLPINTIKFHQLQILRGTRLAQQWEREDVDLIGWTPLQYARFCKQLLQVLPENIIIERMVSTSPKSLLLHPKWDIKPAQYTAY